MTDYNCNLECKLVCFSLVSLNNFIPFRCTSYLSFFSACSEPDENSPMYRNSVEPGILFFR